MAPITPTLPSFLQALEQGEAGGRPDQVVDLVEVDAAEPVQRALGLALGLGVVGRPQLVGDERLVAAALEAVREHARRLAVHRRGVEKRRAGVERGVDDVVAVAADVERLPRAHADDGHARPARAELTRLHRPAASGARRAYRLVAFAHGVAHPVHVWVWSLGHMGRLPRDRRPESGGSLVQLGGVAVAKDTRSVSRRGSPA